MSSLSKHARVTVALMVREISTRYGSKPGGYVWALVDPVAHVALMTIIFQAIARMPALGSSFALFFATGYLPYMFYSSMSGFVTGAVRANRALLNYPIVAPVDCVIARYFVQFLTSGLVAFLVLMFVVMEDDVSLSIDEGKIASACLFATLLGLGIGVANIGLYARSSLYEQVYGIVTRPLFMISGVFFVPDSLPHPFGDYILYNPLTHIIMWFRTGIYPEYRAQGLDIGYVAEFTAIAIFIGVIIFTFSGRYLREEKA
ncbi:ABC transporter permease [Ensifer sp. MPMI2T]|nr:ABC transporter permease [Ensifer sp. MPMI2T]